MKEGYSLTATWNPETRAIELFKLGNNGLIYRWDSQKHSWKLYS